MDGSQSRAPLSLFRKLLPGILFCLGLFVLVAITYDTGYSALPLSENRYSAARAQLEALKGDEKRARHRDQWLRLAGEFLQIHESGATWPNRPAALFRSAEAMEELGRRSLAVRDYEEAVKRYEDVAKLHARSCLADDALLRAARIRHEHLRDNRGALRNLRCIRVNMPGCDMAAQAARLEKSIAQQSGAAEAAGPKRAGAGRATVTPPAAAPLVVAEQAAQIKRVSWRTLNEKKVEITVELNRNAKWAADLTRADRGKGNGARLALTVSNAAPAASVKAGARVKNSLLSRVQVAGRNERQTTLHFDFHSACTYEAAVRLQPFRIVLTVRGGADAPVNTAVARNRFSEATLAPRGASPEAGQKGDEPRLARATRKPPVTLPAPQATVQAVPAAISRNMAAQLGLGVQTIYIDAGHGGHDPGTTHNDLVERELTLDMARRVGRLLAANGLEVVYTRTKNVHVPLSARPRRANENRADLFVSIHLNANHNAAIQGFETYYLDFARSNEAARVAALENGGSDRKLGDMQRVLADIMQNARTHESRDLARDIQRRSLHRLQKRGYTVVDGGVRSAPFHVLIGAGMPAVLVEVGYCTHAQEAARLRTAEYRHALAEGIAEGILTYKSNLKRRQSAQFTLTGVQPSAM